VSNVEGISVMIAESEPGAAVLFDDVATGVTVLKVEDGAVAVNISKVPFETGAIIPILFTVGTPILRTEVVSAADGAHIPFHSNEVAVGVTMARVGGAPKLTPPAVVGTAEIVTSAMALLLEMVGVTELVIVVTVASEEKPLA
jgi:hypothetical protein